MLQGTHHFCGGCRGTLVEPKPRFGQYPEKSPNSIVGPPFPYYSHTIYFRFACSVVGKNRKIEKTYSPQNGDFHGDESHARKSKKTPTKQTRVDVSLPGVYPP